MIVVAGGAYTECCMSPSWNYLFGSGVRAVAALSKFSKDISLHTYIGQNEEDQLDLLSQLYGFEVKYTVIDSTVHFDYVHGLASPDIYPPRHLINPNNPLHIDSEIVLRFGFMEGDAVVQGDRVIYDPQSAEKPIPFHKNGSTANHLAIVANLKEVSLLAGTGDLGKIINLLQKNHQAEVLVIKRGSFGCDVVVGNKKKHIPAFKTERVWPIGSGDIFAAIFSHYWGEDGMSPFEAAEQASIATASYCSNQLFPEPRTDGLKSLPFKAVQPTTTKNHQKRTVYLAGPFFTLGQRWVVEQARECLVRQGLNVFSPLHDVGRGCGTDVAPADLAGLDKSDLVFAIVDGLDTGTIFEYSGPQK